MHVPPLNASFVKKATSSWFIPPIRLQPNPPSLLQGTSSALLRHLMWLSLTSMKSLSLGTQQNVWRNNDNDITPQLPCPSSSGGLQENRLPPHSCPRKLWPSPITLVLFECMCHYSTGDLFLWLPEADFIPVLNHLLANGKRRDNGIKMRLRFFIFPWNDFGEASKHEQQPTNTHLDSTMGRCSHTRVKKGAAVYYVFTSPKLLRHLSACRGTPMKVPALGDSFRSLFSNLHLKWDHNTPSSSSPPITDN